MSTLTKILIILLVLSSIFLCGIVVTYIANADNYEQKYKSLKSDKDSLSAEVSNLTKRVNETIAEKEALEERLQAEITSLKGQMNELRANLSDSEREKATLLQKVNSWASITKDFYDTNDKQGQLLKNTLEELNKAQAEQVKQNKELNETTAALIDKIAIIESLETENKRLVEEKTELQNRLDKYLQPIGKTAAEAIPVTPRVGTARPAMPSGIRNIDLQGLITAVDLKNFMASISIGAADGVKEGMRFHATRGNEFLCDILIIDVDSDEAIGVMELVQKQPKAGDSVSTNL